MVHRRRNGEHYSRSPIDNATKILSTVMPSTRDNHKDSVSTSSIPSSQTLNRYTFMPGFMQCTSAITDFSPKDFPLPSIIGFRIRSFESMPYSIAGATRPGFVTASYDLMFDHRLETDFSLQFQRSLIIILMG